MLVPLDQAAHGTCGSKATALGALRRAGLPVPDGFVLPNAVHDASADALPGPVRSAIADALAHLGDPVVAVRSSAADEDTGESSAAGRYASFLAVQGMPAVADAVRACWASATVPARRDAEDGRDLPTDADRPSMAVIVHHHLDADVSGVLFTPADPDGPTVIESTWGLGPSVVGGTVTPDTYRVTADGSVSCAVADKRTRLDRVGTRLVTRAVPSDRRTHPSLDESTARRLAALGAEVAALLDGPQDIEWAVVDDRVWLLQARPVTAALPTNSHAPATPGHRDALSGTPGSRGAATGTARTVRGPRDFARVRPGDILVCPFTDPAWTPLLRVAAGVVTATGGALSHAAIVAREHGIPAVLGVPDAMTAIPDGATVTLDGTLGTVAVLPDPGA